MNPTADGRTDGDDASELEVGDDVAVDGSGGAAVKGTGEATATVSHADFGIRNPDFGACRTTLTCDAV